MCFHQNLTSDSRCHRQWAEKGWTLDRRSMYQTKRNLSGKVLRLLRTMRLEGRMGELARELLAREKALSAPSSPGRAPSRRTGGP